jgi:hypothetical protein
MVGFIVAALQLELPFTFIRSLVVSDPSTSREGWPYVDALPDERICSPPDSAKLPVVLHYCKRYLLGEVCFYFIFYLFESSFEAVSYSAFTFSGSLANID